MMKTLKSDDEPAMTLSSTRKDLRSHLAVVKEASEYEPQAKGLAERCVQTAKGMRVIVRSDLEHRLGCDVPHDNGSYLVGQGQRV